MLPLERIAATFIEIFRPLEVCLGIAGGGCKAFYALGVGHELRKWGIKLSQLSGVSAGSAMALCLLSEEEETAVEYFEEITKRNDSNFKLSNLFFGERVFPHESMYRRTIRFAMNWEKIKASRTRIYIHTVKAIPQLEDGIMSKYVIAKLIAETAQAFTRDEKDRIAGIPCNRVQEILRKWNMTEVIFTEKDFLSPDVLEQIIMNSSSIPPVVSIQNIQNEYYLDGGLTNNLLLENFPKNLPKIGIYYEDSTLIGKSPSVLNDCFLIKPSKTLPITSFDYTNPVGVRKAYELGKSDAIQMKDEIINYIRKKQFFEIPKLFN
ncbi:MAG: patatin-like phospholipase family protein [Leptospira sp.]|jgi:predicted patatin/cPLA2 family phospholipase|nr:patatin-like phospholipase family protein [Leptospira sp.]NCS92638.1 patatin-like phospholipase family protein [Leptospira sp.]